ncbi:MAG: redox-sensing transcriptional repressor Rex [Polyangiaceae bacterium]|jgi:redox-sensing transcriptional repressor
MTDPTSELRVVPEPTLRRLPRYLHLLRTLRGQREWISTTHIGDALGLEPVQVRKDIECTTIVGRPKTGYSVPALIDAIETLLGWNNPRQAFLVGAGNLGRALLGYPRFEESGLDIVAAFDSDPKKVGKEIHGKKVLPFDKFENLAQRMHVIVGIITVPAEQAQTVAEHMLFGGIRAIWNFAPVALTIPKDIIVQNEDLYTGLASLSHRLADVLRKDASIEKGIRHASL